MIGYGLWLGERLLLRQWLGLICAFAGLAGLLLPGLSAPPLLGSVLILVAGVAWGVYSLRGKAAGDPIQVSSGNFLHAAPHGHAAESVHGVLEFGGHGWLGVCTGLWSPRLGCRLCDLVHSLGGLKATSAATVQLSVPVLAAMGGVAFLGETVTWRLLLASAAILGGIALVMLHKQAAR